MRELGRRKTGGRRGGDIHEGGGRETDGRELEWRQMEMRRGRDNTEKRRGGDRREGGEMETDGMEEGRRQTGVSWDGDRRARGHFYGHCLPNREKKEETRQQNQKRAGQWPMTITITYMQNNFIFKEAKSAFENFFSSGISEYEYISPPVLKLL
jgi:hypothetical protein